MMAIQILSEPPAEPEEVRERLEAAIRAHFSDAEIEVVASSPGHFEVTVVSPLFEGMPKVKQQQRVYTAIRELMTGDSAPVHAIDRMVTRTP